jgi:hypothetical protein
MTPMEYEVKYVGIKFFHNVVGAVVSECGAPVLENASDAPILRRVVDGGNALLKELAGDLGDVECRLAGILARDYGACSGVIDPRFDGVTWTFAEIARVVVQDAGQKSENEK